MANEWFPIESAPDGFRVDVFYRNTTFTKPVEGVLAGARLEKNFWKDHNGVGIPAIFAVSWRPVGANAKMGAFAGG